MSCPKVDCRHFKSRFEKFRMQNFSIFMHVHCLCVCSVVPSCDGRTRILIHLQKKRLCFIPELSPYRAVNTTSAIQTQSVSTVQGKVAVCSQILAKHNVSTV